MHLLLTLIRKDFTMLRRNRGAFILTFVVPLALIYIVGQVFGLNRKEGGGSPNGIRLAVVNASNHPAAAKLVDALRADSTFRVITTTANPDKSERPLTVDDLRPMIRDRKFQYALVIPANVIATDHLGLNLETYTDPRNQIETQIVNGMLQKTIFSNVPQLIGESLKSRAKNSIGDQKLSDFNRTIANTTAASFGGDPEKIFTQMQNGDFGFDRLLGSSFSKPEANENGKPAANKDSDAAGFLSQIVKIKNEQVVGKEVKSPEATRIVGGYAVMFLLFALSGSSAAFFDEKRSGIFQRLLSTPVSRAHLLWSRFLYGVLFGLIQLVVLFSAGSFLYGIDVVHHLGGLIVICAATAACCTAFGMLLAAFTASQQAANSISTLLVLTMSACGGAWFPISFLPETMQRFAPFTIVYWALEGFSQVLWAGRNLVQILPTVGVLLGVSVVVMTLAVWRFNRSKIFE